MISFLPHDFPFDDTFGFIAHDDDFSFKVGLMKIVSVRVFGVIQAD